ncbi:MAG: N-acetyl-gamma-glutamyl-phosphate reductase, partial [Candidatus Omnitrophica bacterium]|nr:N-acetyl-gamma-glutamyl-phosphate reductase [Candidatus Omnitrophota bacterium]
FLALPHTVSMEFAPLFLDEGKKVIDLSGDYRLAPEVYEKWYGKEHTDKDNLAKAVYGLPELNREDIKKASLIANPGCYPTSVVLGLLPLAGKTGKADIIADAKSGATGAGRKASVPLSFSEVDEDLKCYKANSHQHMPEMERALSSAAGSGVTINFVPHLVPMRRGILSTIYVKASGLPAEAEVREIYRDFYEAEPFVRVKPRGELPRIADVVNTNFCDIGLTVANGMLVVVSVIDNLLKGASGQAVQNMNLVSGFPETAGLI